MTLLAFFFSFFLSLFLPSGLSFLVKSERWRKEAIRSTAIKRQELLLSIMRPIESSRLFVAFSGHETYYKYIVVYRWVPFIRRSLVTFSFIPGKWEKENNSRRFSSILFFQSVCECLEWLVYVERNSCESNAIFHASLYTSLYCMKTVLSRANEVQSERKRQIYATLYLSLSPVDFSDYL